MLIEFIFKNERYDYRNGELGRDGVFKLNIEKRGYELLEVLSEDVQTKVDELIAENPEGLVLTVEEKATFQAEQEAKFKE